MTSTSRQIITIFILVFGFIPNAFAYLDPGTGSILIQGLIAAIAGGLYTLRLYWARIKAFFSSDSEELDTSTDMESESNASSNEAND